MEIERKWLISAADIPHRPEELSHKEIEQAYISFSPVIRIRSIDDEEFVLTVKSKAMSEFSREEFEMPISRGDYNELMKKAEGNIIRKTRYFFRRSDNLLEEIDIFKGMFEGLAYLEIEFETEEDAVNFQSPEWVIRDVTAEKGFTNGALARYGMPEI